MIKHRRTQNIVHRHVDPTNAQHAADCPTGMMTVSATSGYCPKCGPLGYSKHAAKHRLG